MLDYLWIARFWGWAGHAARLKNPNPAAQWISFHDVNWWREQQKDPQGRRHQGTAGNTSRWEDPIMRYTPVKHKIGRDGRNVWGFLEQHQHGSSPTS